MRIRFSDAFIQKFEHQIRFIAKDKPVAARKFRKELRSKIIEIPERYNSYRRNFDFKDIEVRELIYKGYTVSFKVDRPSKTILIFSFTQWDEPTLLP